MTVRWASCSNASIPENHFGLLQVVQRIDIGDATNIVKIDKCY